MAMSRREFQVLQQQVARLEAKLGAIEAHLKAHDSALKHENLLRKVREAETKEKEKEDRVELYVSPDVVTSIAAPEPAPEEAEPDPDTSVEDQLRIAFARALKKRSGTSDPGG